MKNYKEIGYAGLTIDETVSRLLKYHDNGELASCEFNGTMLYSDTVTLEGAYMAITGRTKAECDAAKQKQHEDYLREEKEHQDKIPTLTKEWLEKGRHFVRTDKLELWDECVPIRLSDLYHGMELGACEEIITALNNGCTMEEAKTIIGNQGHSGMSFGLVRAMVKEFAERGNEFAAYVN